MKSAGKKNEIASAQHMIEMLELKSATVTFGAMHCQRETGKGIVKKRGGDVLKVKKNQLGLYASVVDLFDGLRNLAAGPRGARSSSTPMRVMGALRDAATRICPAPKGFEGRAKWAALKTLIRVTRIRHVNDTTSTETMYYIASLDTGDPERIARAIRSH
ncbi:MAG: putative transposase YbfD/YdcC [Gammaproteobacteria bacterium]|jgi:predicted transposase YbfD/YdcC